MIEKLKSFYEMDFCVVKKIDEGYAIIYHNRSYLLFMIDSTKNISNYYDLSQKIHYSYSFIPNKYGKLVSNMDNHSFVLFMIKPYSISFDDILNPYITDTIISLNWRDKWIQNSKDLPSLYQKIRGKYAIVDESIPYYSSLLDLAIYLLNDYSYYQSIGYVQHIFFNETTFGNPFYYLFDIKERDIAGYLKFLFYHNDLYYESFYKILNRSSKVNCYILLVRLIYPDWYLLELEKIVFYHKNIDDLERIVSKTNDYIKLIYEFTAFCGIKKVSL